MAVVVPKRKKKLNSKKVGEEVMIYDTESSMVHIVNSVAGKIFELCDGDHTIEQIVEEIPVSFSIEDGDGEILKDVHEIVNNFNNLGLFE